MEKIKSSICAEEAPIYRAEFERVITQISTEFINLPLEEINTGINRALQILGEFARVDRSYIFQFYQNGKIMSNTHEWCERGIDPQMHRLQEVPTDFLSWITERIFRLETVHVPRVDDLPPEASTEKEECRAQGIKSFIAVPMASGRSCIGALGFDSVITEKQWSEDIIVLLRLAAQAIANSLERMRAEEELLREKNFSDTVLNSMPGIFYLFDEEGNLIRWNKNLEDVSGYTADEIRRMKPTAFVADDDKELIAERILEVLREGRSSAEANLATKSGRKILHYFTGFRFVMDGKTYVLGIGIDIASQKRVEDALRESEKRYRIVVEDVPAMICRFLPDGTLTFVNSAYCNQFGKTKEELIGHNFFQHFPPKAQDKVKHRLMSLNPERPMTTKEYRIIAPDGKVHWQEWTDRALFDEHGHVVEFQSIGRNVTENRLAQQEKAKIEKQLQQAQKMEAIGTLAGGIAHDFNNILAAIIGYAGMMEIFDVPEDSPMQAKLKEVLKAANRAKDLVRQILTFSRQTDQEYQPVQLNYIVKDSLKFLRASLPTTIEIRQHIPGAEIIAMADPTQMHQVLINLCTNAAHAMQETGGRLEVELSAMDLDAQSAEWFPELKPGPHLKLTVSDTGHGMTSEVMERIFDPFFTTKKPGEGTGMGLAVVHGIVKSHGGIITVDSQLGKGTTFQVMLPRIEMATAEPIDRTAAPMPKGTERILFVDDEQTLVEIVRYLLERLGYDVVTKTSSREALELFRSRPERFDLVITDQTMPHITGLELAREILRIRSDMPIVLCTGHSEKATPERIAAAGIRELVTKPLDPSGFAKTIREVLDQ